MTLQEFADHNEGFIKNRLNNMKQQTIMKETIKDPEERKYNRDRLYSSYYIVFGYIQAAYSYGHISWQEKILLEDELDKIITGGGV